MWALKSTVGARLNLNFILTMGAQKGLHGWNSGRVLISLEQFLKINEYGELKKHWP
jgi:hypothetical protein